MNLRHMEVFRAVMLTGGVNGAAELLHISQPAISKLLARAARQSGMKLFERVKGRLVPTPEAQALHQEIEKLWRALEHVREVSRGLAHPTTGSLRLAVSASLAPHLAPRAITLLQARFPRLESRIEVLVAPIMVDALLDRSADLAVGASRRPHHPRPIPAAVGRAPGLLRGFWPRLGRGDGLRIRPAAVGIIEPAT